MRATAGLRTDFDWRQRAFGIHPLQTLGSRPFPAIAHQCA